MSERLLRPEFLGARVTRRPDVLVAAAWILTLIIAVALADILFPGGPLTQELTNTYAMPTPAHLLGTDALGRDLLARVLFGARITLVGALLGTAVAILLGVPAGLVAGYFGGWVDRTLGFLADIALSVPLLLVILLAFAIFPNNSAVSMTLFGIATSAAVFRIVRGATLTVASELFVTAARASGLSHAAVIARHVASRLQGLVFVQTAVIIAIALVLQVGLGFLGLDVAPPNPSWGGMIADASRGLFVSVWPLVPPSLIVVITVLAFSILGDLAQDRRLARVTRSTPRSRTTPESATPLQQDANRLLTVTGLTVATTASTGESTFLIQDVSFHVDSGEILGIVGESGAGKSVTARALLALNGKVTTSGSALWAGHDLLQMSERELRRVRGAGIGYISQDPMSSLDPLYTVGSQLREAVRNHGTKGRGAAQLRVMELLDAARIPDPAAVSAKYPFELSGGMAQRVCIALALAGNPALLIADEPTTALDVTVQMEVLGLLQRLRDERGLAIILVTHDWGVVADTCGRAMTMYAGEVVESALVSEIFTDPLHPYTVALRRADPHALPVGERLSSIPGTLPAPGEWPRGCRFADRCALVEDRCRETHPMLQPAADDHLSRCLRVDALRLETRRSGKN